MSPAELNAQDASDPAFCVGIQICGVGDLSARAVEPAHLFLPLSIPFTSFLKS
jgi:hypothetical protein